MNEYLYLLSPSTPSFFCLAKTSFFFKNKTETFSRKPSRLIPRAVQVACPSVVETLHSLIYDFHSKSSQGVWCVLTHQFWSGDLASALDIGLPKEQDSPPHPIGLLIIC